MRRDIADPRGFAAGSLFLVIGVAAGLLARDYRMGTALRMGPGYYPFALALLLGLTGLAAMLRSLRAPGAVISATVWRPALIITAAVAAFAMLIDRAGLVPATVIAVGLAGLAVRPVRPAEIIILAAGLAVLAAGVFVFGLKLPFALFG